MPFILRVLQVRLLSNSLIRSYNVGNLFLQNPAIDLSAKIIGVSSTNTITFKPSDEMAITRGAVTINMNSGSGVGVLFGQNLNPSNFNAAVSGAETIYKKVFAKSDGFITFDGGNQKSLRFALNATGNFRAAFYLAQGASNITIKNCIINNSDQATPNFASSIPLTRYSASISMFTFEQDNRNAIGYTSGILLRSIAPMDKSGTTNLYHLDSLPNTNNLIASNEIDGFGYGVVSIGIGPLFDGNRAKYLHFYNHDNLITGNKIQNVGRAGIFVGFEENSTFSYNKIFNVTGQTGVDAAGIIIGGEKLSTSQYFGYNNMNVSVLSNEISNVFSNNMAYGIKVEQSRNGYPFSSPPFYFLPDKTESMRIASNAIWGLSTQSQNASRIGIRLFTERAGLNDPWQNSITPILRDYYTRNDAIVNNTIRITGDGGLMTAGVLAGIAIQQAKGTQLFNNAIAMEDFDVDPLSPVNAAIFYEGRIPNTGDFTSDHNAIWASANANAAAYRFMENDNYNNILDSSKRDDYKTLSQWFNWTGQDEHSVFGDFTGDLTYVGSDPDLRLRVITTPQTPFGSLLNNRGNKIDWVTTDIDGNARGASGQRYDIGASEFDGRMSLTDVEALSILKPANLQDQPGYICRR